MWFGAISSYSSSYIVLAQIQEEEFGIWKRRGNEYSGQLIAVGLMKKVHTWHKPLPQLRPW